MDKANSGNFAGNTNAGFVKNIESLQKGLLEIALCHRRIIFITIVFSLVAGFIYLLAAKPIYTGTARIYVEQTGPKLITDYTTVMGDSKNYLYTQRELIRSTPIIANVANNSQIRAGKTFHNIDNIVAYMKNKLDVGVGKKDDIITISFDSPYPAEAAQIVNAVIDGYVEYHTTHKKGTVLEVLKILQKEKNKRDQELSEQMKQMLEFSQKNGLVAISGNSSNIVLQRYSKLSDALTQTQLETINAKAEYEALLNMKDDPSKIRQIVRTISINAANPALKEREAQLQMQLTQFESRLDELLKNCTENHPSVKATKARIKEINEQLEKQNGEFAEAYLEILHQKYLTAKEMENQLAKSCEEEQQTAQDAGVKTTEFSILNAQIKRTERLCEILDQRIKELNVAEDTGALNISILEAARTPEMPSKPQKAKIMTFALFLGFLASFALAFIREQLDNRLHSAEEVAAVLGIPVLGIIPNITSKKKDVTNIWQKFRNTTTKTVKAIGAVLPINGANNTTDKHEKRDIGLEDKSPAGGFARKLEGLQTTLKSGHQAATMATSSREGVSKTTTNSPGTNMKERQTDEKNNQIQRGQKVRLQSKSVAAEAYRTIRTSIFFGVPKGQAKTILITSPTTGDGKSTLVSNLGLAMAQAGQKTIIVDCDFRRPMQHNIFDLDRDCGLSNVITGNTLLDSAIQHGPIDNIDILACGTDAPNPSELLNSESFGKILNELSNRYDRVLIDSPPVMPVADSQILGAICDITIIVLRAEKSTRKLSKLACENLIGVGSHLLGAVINDVPQPKGRYGYYNYHRYGYSSYGYGDGYGYYDSKEEKKESEKVYT